MQYAQDIALKRVGILIEHYVVARSTSCDFVSTESACQAVRPFMRSPVDDAALDLVLARKASRQGLSVRFDRMGHWSNVLPVARKGGLE
ncbi:hypothetical protein EN851_23205 [Mesorhizobium sp. M8A.F.Ca.ET.208.01.1.1]|uniref:hypothetical protein n=1 Tax=unclassified Mesorhizobium TaxID=325217 RepID=UPI0010921510|nr:MULTISPECIES: hypothetical protein [unclassified Mesorhizobium]TGU40166.1 hypothetical protein EN799_07020 [bacterium M00.F.Ca.ET.156.01.1.1]TGV15041.1 hypothetical protein EN816_06255 [Mesorhizobium sp. M8A.F.Ca.ET.173.01.1.1]TGQ89184.1 hypothetical protein EN851_23205 [Mesorhizobium sp. M8A.F.Ca.ET.208.01.1.1]TGR32287.1 hypothetical protein EN845_07020 [Mesorhizobium sp. M8A.F.Ca.ET.202.01.1.1]TGT50503.1 hypothetical protein EN810_23105 [Mesorhizobium sp. M8A.F.Ca.ET.167.01.1.1]